MKWWTHTFEEDETDVVAELSEKWPDITVRIRPRGRGIEIRGLVHPDGRIATCTIEADDETGEVTTAAARSLPAIITALKEWNAVAREDAAQILAAGDPDARTVVDAKPAMDSLRALFYNVPRAPGTRKRGADAELMLRQVVEAYTEASAAGDPTPRKTVAERFGYTPEYISRLLQRARQPRNGKPPLLSPREEPATFGRPGQPVIAAIVTSDRGVLVTRRVDQNPPWGFVAGWGEPGESPADTIIREAKEEADIRIQVGEYLGERDHPATGRHMIYYAARPTHGTEIHLGDKGELSEVRWVSLAEADELLPGMFEPVREHLARELGQG